MSKSKKEHHEEHIDETWLIPYADLLTLLLALFIILFASSQMDSKKYDSIMRSLNAAFTGGTAPFAPSSLIPINEEANATKKSSDMSQDVSKIKENGANPVDEKMKKEEQDLEELKQNLDQFIKENGLTAQLETKLTNEKLMITISDRALFDSGSAVVKGEAQKLAVSISEMLGQYPTYQVEVAGHTDNIPIRNAEFETNWDLSSKRALNFMKILFNNAKIDPAMFSSIGYGEYRPVDANDTLDGRAKNRRVEVNILRNYTSGAAAAE